MATWERFQDLLKASALRDDPSLNNYLRGMAHIGNVYSEVTLRVTPLPELFKKQSSYIPSVTRGLGIANRMWQAISENPETHRYDPAFAASNMISLRVPWMGASENVGLRKFFGHKFYEDLSDKEKEVLLIAHSEWIRRNPADEPNILVHLPAATWSVVRDWATKPRQMIDEAIRSWEAFGIPWKTILTVAGLGLAVWIFLPQIGAAVGRARRA